MHFYKPLESPCNIENPSENPEHSCKPKASPCMPPKRAENSMQNLAYTPASVCPLYAVA